MHRGYQNWSRIYLEVLSRAVKMTSCRKVLDGVEALSSPTSHPGFAGLCYTARATGMQQALNCGARTECKSRSGHSHVYISAELWTEGRFPSCLSSFYHYSTMLCAFMVVKMQCSWPASLNGSMH